MLLSRQTNRVAMIGCKKQKMEDGKVGVKREGSGDMVKGKKGAGKA